MAQIDLPIIVLAGGLATRLRPITETIPKALVDIQGKPFMHHQLKLLKARGFQKVIASVGYLGEMIEKEFGAGEKYGLEISYCYDGPKLLGTGGAVLKASKDLKGPFFIIYGDSYLPIDYSAVLKQYKAQPLKTLMTVFHNQDQYDVSNVCFKEGKVFYDKRTRLPEMHYIDYGLIISERSEFSEYIDKEAFDLAEALSRLSKKGLVAGFETQQRFYEVGSKKGLEELNELEELGQ